MTLANYLETPQAREDVGRLLADSPARDVTLAGGRIWRKPDGQAFHSVSGLKVDTLLTLKPQEAWQLVRISQRDARLAMVPKITAYYRPDGDRFVVTDLGEGVRALRLKGCALLDIKPKVDEVLMQMYQAGLLHPNYGPAALIQGEIGTIGNVTAADLPDALCRVMLASLKVSEVQP